MTITRISFSGPKKTQLLQARAAFFALRNASVDMLRHEQVLSTRDVYIDALCDETRATTALGPLPPGAQLHTVVAADTDPCLKCGNLPEQPVAVCPNCDYREIDNCPSCDNPTPRQLYGDAPGNIGTCASCGAKVLLEFNQPLWHEDGTLNTPAILVRALGERR